MSILKNTIKLSTTLLFLVIANYSFAQNCAVLEFENQLTISMSPGFLSGAITYVGSQECTESGICLHIPQLCPNSSCCVSSTLNNFSAHISIPSALSQSKCGCWDSVRKICKAVSNFHIGYSACKSQNGGKIQRKIEISHGSREIMSKICNENTAVVELSFDNEVSGIILKIKLVACAQQSRREGGKLSKGGLLDGQITIIDDLTGEYIIYVKRRDMLKTSADFSKFLIGNDFHRENASLQCAIPTRSDSFSMSSNFLSGTINNFLNLNAGKCSGHGTCKISAPECESTSCCLVSTSWGENSSGDSCECLPSGLGIGGNGSVSCLVHHKVYKVLTSFCTETGERVQRSLSVRNPSNGLNRCISDAKSWEMAAMKFKTNKNGNLEAVIEIRKCILSEVNANFLEIEETIKAELNLDIVSKLAKQME